MFSKPVRMNNVTDSGGSSNFKIDVIFNSLRELQQGELTLCGQTKHKLVLFSVLTIII